MEINRNKQKSLLSPFNFPIIVVQNRIPQKSEVVCALGHLRSIVETHINTPC
jgi:hypothetical protein